MTEYEANQVLDNYLKLPDVFKYYGYEIKANGFCCCPFHNEKTASCKVNDFQYHCFGCDARGNAVSFVKYLFNVDFKTAIQKINDDFGLGLLTSELTIEQKQKIKRQQIIKYEKNQTEKTIENIKNEYLQAWKHLTIYKPEEKNYDINTPQYLVDEYFANLDPRYLKAKETIARLDIYAKIYNFEIDEWDAKWMFTK